MILMPSLPLDRIVETAAVFDDFCHADEAQARLEGHLMENLHALPDDALWSLNLALDEMQGARVEARR